MQFQGIAFGARNFLFYQINFTGTGGLTTTSALHSDQGQVHALFQMEMVELQMRLMLHV